MSSPSYDVVTDLDCVLIQFLCQRIRGTVEVKQQQNET